MVTMGAIFVTILQTLHSLSRSAALSPNTPIPPVTYQQVTIPDPYNSC